MKTDRELLELAAKAAGYIRTEYTEMAEEGDYGFVVWDSDGKADNFYPLTKDADAFRLAAKLSFSIHVQNAAIGVSQYRVGTYLGGWLPRGLDNARDYRVAIVHAAAAIGETP